MSASPLREDRAFAATPSSPQAVSPVPASIPLRGVVCSCGAKKKRQSKRCVGCYRRFWTAEEDALLAKLSATGKTYAEIGLLMGRTYNAVNGRACFLKLGLSRAAVLENRRKGREAFRADQEKMAVRSAKMSRSFTPARRRALAEKMRGNKRAVGSWEGKEYPESAKALISAARTKQWAQRIGVPREHPLRNLYYQLRKKVGSPDAIRIIRDEIARLPGLEQQLLKLQLGATISRKIEAPTKQYDYTLGGVSA